MRPKKNKNINNNNNKTAEAAAAAATPGGITNAYLDWAARSACPRTYVGTFASDQLESQGWAALEARAASGISSTLCVNLDPSDKPGSHFVAVSTCYGGSGRRSRSRRAVLYFDSLGLPAGVGTQPLVRRFVARRLLATGHRLLEVNRRLQWPLSDFCGIYVLAFAVWVEQEAAAGGEFLAASFYRGYQLPSMTPKEAAENQEKAVARVTSHVGRLPPPPPPHAWQE